jgi:predicted dehydrogenase
MTADKLRVGIIGCGEVAALHLASIKRIPQAAVTAVCDRNETLAKLMAGRAKIDNYYTESSEMLAAEKLDVVHITTPPQTHFALAVQALEVGCHVLAEKPLALNLDEFDKMTALAAKKGVKLNVVHNVLFRPVVVKAKEMVKKGLIGYITGLAITQCVSARGDLVPYPNHWCHKLPGGIFGEMSPHSIYLANAFMPGLKVAAVYKQKLSRNDWMAADELRVILKSSSGVASITNSASGLARYMTLDLAGTRGSMHVNISSGVIVRHMPIKGGRLRWGLDNIWTASQNLTGTASGLLRFFFSSSSDEHHNIIKGFTDSILNNGQPPVSLEEARAVTDIYQQVTGG